MSFRVFLLCLTFYMCETGAKAQSLITGAFNNALEAVQHGLDLIWPDDLAPEGVTAKIGFGVGFTPDYVGSDDYGLRIVPLLDIRYKDSWRLNGSALTYRAFKHGSFEAGPLLSLRFGRDESNSDVLRGIGDINTTFETGAFAQYQTKTGLVSMEYRYGLGAGIGSSLRLTAGHGVFKKGNFIAMLVGRVKWLSNKSMQTNFGITQKQSDNSAVGLSVYRPRAGVAEASVNLLGSYQVNPQTRLMNLISYGRLLGDAKNSPLVIGNTGSKTQLVVGSGFIFSF